MKSKVYYDLLFFKTSFKIDLLLFYWLSGKNHNFRKYGTNIIDSRGTPYDYGSVMHYRSTSFSKNGKPTIVTKKPGVSNKLVHY